MSGGPHSETPLSDWLRAKVHQAEALEREAQRLRETARREFGLALEHARKARGLSRPQVSNVAGFTPDYLKQVEYGHKYVSPESAERIEKALESARKETKRGKRK